MYRVTFFDAHAPVYGENVFTKNTFKEVDFLLEELEIATGGSVLDVGCGTGRHSVELARRGYAVTGLDLSSEMLAMASAAAKATRTSSARPTAKQPSGRARSTTCGNWASLAGKADPGRKHGWMRPGHPIRT